MLVQTLLLWQGGFLFYTAVVVPIGTDAHGAFNQGRITREVTVVMNIIGAVALVVFAWDQWHERSRWRWASWSVLALTLFGLLMLHGRIDAHIDFGAGYIADYPRFYFWHRVYLYVATLQWLAGLVYTGQLVRMWSKRA